MPRAVVSVPAKPRVQSVARAAAILRELAASAEGLTPGELSHSLGLTRPTTYHLLNTLAADRLVKQGEARRYRLGLGVAALAEGFRRQFSPEDLVPHIRALARQLGEATHVVGWSDGEIVVLARVPGRRVVSISEFPLGMIGDAHARSSGKLLLAYAAEPVRAEYLRTHPRRRRTTRTLVRLGELAAEFERIRERGYAIDREEFEPGLCCLAAPLDGGQSPYAFSISAPKERFEAEFECYRAALLEVAAAASGGAR
jgi:IclR family transcriptional regulator, acetate operon repressor